MNEIKKDELDHVTIKNEVLRKYFPKSYTCLLYTSPRLGSLLPAMLHPPAQKRGHTAQRRGRSCRPVSYTQLNNFARRVPILEEQMKVANHRIADLEQNEKVRN